MHGGRNARFERYGKQAAIMPLFVTLVAWLALLLTVQAPLHRLHALGALASAGAQHVVFPQGGQHPAGGHAQHRQHERGQYAGNPGHERKHTLRDCVCCAPSLLGLPPVLPLLLYGSAGTSRVERHAGFAHDRPARPTARGPPPLLG